VIFTRKIRLVYLMELGTSVPEQRSIHEPVSLGLHKALHGSAGHHRPRNAANGESNPADAPTSSAQSFPSPNSIDMLSMPIQSQPVAKGHGHLLYSRSTSFNHSYLGGSAQYGQCKP
jgi:hypothetical protein